MKHPLRCECDSCQKERELEKNHWSVRRKLDHDEETGARSALNIKKLIDNICRGTYNRKETDGHIKL